MQKLCTLFPTCHAAPVVWCALMQYAQRRGSVSFRLSRRLLSQLTGIKSVQTVSAALKALETAEWLTRKAVFRAKAGAVTACVHVCLLLGPENDFSLAHRVRRKASMMSSPLPSPHALREQPLPDRPMDDLRRPRTLDLDIRPESLEDAEHWHRDFTQLLQVMEAKYQSICCEDASAVNNNKCLESLLAWCREARCRLEQLERAFPQLAAVKSGDTPYPVPV